MTSPTLLVNEGETDIIDHGPALVANWSEYIGHFPEGIDPNRSHAFDGFFQSIAAAHPGLDFGTLLDGNTLATYVSEMYSAYWAIFLASMRVPVTNKTRVEGMVHYQEDRLTVAPATVFIIEALLGMILLCLLVSMWLMRGAERVLIKAPYSIAAHISLLEGSRMLDIFREKIEERGPLSEGDIKELLEGYVVRLGWYTRDDGTERYGLELIPNIIA